MAVPAADMLSEALEASAEPVAVPAVDCIVGPELAPVVARVVEPVELEPVELAPQPAEALLASPSPLFPLG